MSADFDDVFDSGLTTKTYDRAAAKASIPNTVFQKAVVIEVINDPAAFKNQFEFDKKYAGTKIENSVYLDRAPRNSILARIVSAGAGTRTDKAMLCLPFFPSHLCFPVKPGETVWLISPTPIGDSAKIAYWMCRIPTWDDTDDINYTHEDRSNHSGIPAPPATTAEKANNISPSAESNVDEDMYGFGNGTGDQDGFTLGDDPKEFTIQVTGSLAYKSFKFEPVPRLTKMPGDLVMQGSNNTSITLGSTRGFKGGWAEQANDTDRLKDLKDRPLDGKRSSATLVKPDHDPTAADFADAAGADLAKVHSAIDIVAGRGLRIRATAESPSLPTADTDPPDSGDDSNLHAPTYPRIKKTVDPGGARGENLVETSKNPRGFTEDIKDNHKDHSIEGDPDFRYDASRIFIASDGEPDVEFGLNDANDAANVKLSDNVAVPTHAGANIVVKSDHIRIIARKDPTNKDAGVNGSIRIIKEGKVGQADGALEEADSSRAVISIEPDGTIYIEGPKIIIGSRTNVAAAAGGKGDQVFLGDAAATQSAVLGEALASTLICFAIDLANVMHGIGGLQPSTFSLFSHTEGADIGVTGTGLGLKALGNMGTPLLCPAFGGIITKLQENLVHCMSETTKVK